MGPTQSLYKAVRETRFADALACPRCRDRHVIRWGGFSGRYRYMCRHCGRTFSDFTATPLAYVKKPQLWLAFAQCMVECVTVRTAAARLGVDKDTTWRWRHALLAAHARGAARRLTGTLEVVEQRHAWCDKGARFLTREARVRGRSCPSTRAVRAATVLLATDRAGGAAARVLAGRPNRPSVEQFLAQHSCRVRRCLGNSGPLSALSLAAQARGIEYLRVPRWGSPASARSRHHVLNAARYARCFREWLRRFRGVATKYLSRYLHWYSIIEPVQNRPRHLVLEAERAPPDA